jgi:hypothetical protein
MLHFSGSVLIGFISFSEQIAIIYLSSINKPILIMVASYVLFEVRTEHFNIITTYGDHHWTTSYPTVCSAAP